MYILKIFVTLKFFRRRPRNVFLWNRCLWIALRAMNFEVYKIFLGYDLVYEFKEGVKVQEHLF